MSIQKRNASGKGGDQITKLAGGVSAKKKIFVCGVKHISKLRRELQAAGLGLRDTSGRTQCETLLRVLQYLGPRGMNTPEGVGVGFARIATRVFDLENQGWQIDTLRENATTADGLKHCGIARYVFKGRRADSVDPQGVLDLGGGLVRNEAGAPDASHEPAGVRLEHARSRFPRGLPPVDRRPAVDLRPRRRRRVAQGHPRSRPKPNSGDGLRALRVGAS